MATFSTLPLGEARQAVLPPRRAIQEQYRVYLRNLSPDTAGQLELGENDRPITERARLRAAAKSEGINLHIQRRGTTIVFWETEEAPTARTNGQRKGTPRGKRR